MALKVLVDGAVSHSQDAGIKSGVNAVLIIKQSNSCVSIFILLVAHHNVQALFCYQVWLEQLSSM